MSPEEMQEIFDTIESFDDQYSYMTQAMNGAYDQGYLDGLEDGKKMMKEEIDAHDRAMDTKPNKA